MYPRRGMLEGLLLGVQVGESLGMHQMTLYNSDGDAVSFPLSRDPARSNMVRAMSVLFTDQWALSTGRDRQARRVGRVGRAYRANFEFLAKYLIHSLDSGDFSVSAKIKLTQKNQIIMAFGSTFLKKCTQI